MSSTIKVTWRIPSSASEGDAQGIIMSAVLPPLVMQEPAPFAASSALDFPRYVPVVPRCFDICFLHTGTYIGMHTYEII